MKKIISLVAAAVLSLPTFALTLKVGDSFAYLPTKNGKDSVSVVTKIASSANGGYELVLFADNVSYTYAVSAGEQLDLYTKLTPKAKNAEAKRVIITSVSNNSLEFETSAIQSSADAK